MESLNNLNAILTMVLIFMISALVAVRSNSKLCRHLSLYLYARAEALDAADATFKRVKAENQPDYVLPVEEVEA